MNDSTAIAAKPVLDSLLPLASRTAVACELVAMNAGCALPPPDKATVNATLAELASTHVSFSLARLPDSDNMLRNYASSVGEELGALAVRAAALLHTRCCGSDEPASRPLAGATAEAAVLLIEHLRQERQLSRRIAPKPHAPQEPEQDAVTEPQARPGQNGSASEADPRLRDLLSIIRAYTEQGKPLTLRTLAREHGFSQIETHQLVETHGDRLRIVATKSSPRGGRPSAVVCALG